MRSCFVRLLPSFVSGLVHRCPRLGVGWGRYQGIACFDHRHRQLVALLQRVALGKKDPGIGKLGVKVRLHATRVGFAKLARSRVDEGIVFGNLFENLVLVQRLIHAHETVHRGEGAVSVIAALFTGTVGWLVHRELHSIHIHLLSDARP